VPCFFAEIDVLEIIFPEVSCYLGLVACGTVLVIFRSFDSVSGSMAVKGLVFTLLCA
jgi:hypothetical protein